jgi:protein-S-isoprenylcysteine O-methyltransferase Ste14
MHLALAKSYVIYFVFILVGLFTNTVFRITTTTSHTEWVGIAAFIIGSLLIVWAQNTSAAKSTIPYFQHGPYRYLRNPTQIGILILIGGYAVISNSVLFLIAVAIGYLISDISFFKKYETLLHEQYRDQYKEYKNTIPKVL